MKTVNDMLHASRVTKIPVQLRRFRFLAPSSPLPADLKAPKLPVPVIASDGICRTDL